MNSLLPTLIEFNELKTSRLKAQVRQPIYSLRYQAGFDALIVLILASEHDAIVYYVDDHVGLIYEDDTLEIVGAQIEGFERHFLAEHSGVERAWRLQETQASMEDFGDLAMAFERLKPLVAEEVMKAAAERLGPPGEALIRAVA